MEQISVSNSILLSRFVSRLGKKFKILENRGNRQISVSDSILLSRLVSRSGKKFKKFENRGKRSSWNRQVSVSNFILLSEDYPLFLDRGRNLKNWKIGGKGILGTGRFLFPILFYYPDRGRNLKN